MFDPHQNAKHVHCPGERKNWEENVGSVEIERCNEREDPLGYRAVFHRREGEILRTPVNDYVIGASFLRERLEHLKKSGFEAPMTVQAIRMIEKRTGCCLLGAP